METKTIIRKKNTGEPGNGGQFSTRTNPAADISLQTDRAPRAGEYVLSIGTHRGEPYSEPAQVVDIQNGVYTIEFTTPGPGTRIADVPADRLRVDTTRDSAAEVARHEARIRGLDAQKHVAFDAPAAQAQKMVELRAQINDGMWSDLSTQARSALNKIWENQLLEAEINGDDTDVRSIDPDLASIEDSYDSHWRDLVKADHDTRELRIPALGITNEAAEAAHYRSYIGEVHGWTQEAYDHVTRPFREVFGQIHPEDDETRPASWARRPHNVTV